MTLLVALIVAGAGAGYVLLNPPSDLIRNELIARVKEKTGRDLVIGGETKFGFYPTVGVRMTDVTLSAPPGMGGAPTVKMAGLEASVRLSPLLKRDVRIEKLVLREPVFDLRIDKSGRKSWDLALADGGAPVRLAEVTPPPAIPAAATETDAVHMAAAATGGKKPVLDELKFRDVRIENGTIRYADERSGKTQEFTKVGMQMALTAISSPLEANGTATWNGEAFDFDGKLTSVKAALEDRPVKLALNLSGKPIAATYDGTFALRDALDLQGAVTAKAASVRGLVAWLGTSLPNVQGFGALTLSGDLRATPTAVTLSNAKMDLDGATGSGVVGVDTSGAKPFVHANLKLSELDLNTYMTQLGPGHAAKAAAPAPAVVQPVKKAAPPANADPIGDLLNDGGTKVPGITKRANLGANPGTAGGAGWNREPIDFSLLGLFDAEAKLQVARLIYKDVKIGQSLLSGTLKNQVIKASFDDVQLYEGRGKGFVTVDATGDTVNVGANIAVDRVSALPFLKDLADMEWLSGAGKATMALSATGKSQAELVQSLNGKSDFAFANGAIVGFNIPGAVRGLSQGKLSGLKKNPAEKTDFSEFAASFAIQNGVAQNQDLRLVSPLLRVGGTGSVNLPARVLDYVVKPKLVANLEGQGGDADTSGLEVPVRIHGPWEKPSYEPDLKGLLAEPNKTVETVKEIGKQLKGKNSNEIVNEIFNKKDANGQPVKPKKALQQLLEGQ